MLVRQAHRDRTLSASTQRPAVVVTTLIGLCGLMLLTRCASSDNGPAAASGGAGATAHGGAAGTFGLSGAFNVAGTTARSTNGGTGGGSTAGNTGNAGTSGGCAADADCGAGMICETSLCQTAQCAVDADCGAAQSCQMQRCSTISCTPPAVPISLVAASGTLAVGLIGTFNSWSTGAATAAPWTLTQSGDKWSGSFTLSPGDNSYKFFVENAATCLADADAGVSGTCASTADTCLMGHCWSYVSDPTNLDTAPDGFGGLNAIITMSCTGIVPYTPPAGGEGGAGGDGSGCASPTISFSYTDSAATTVAVYGSFDGWSAAAATPLVKGSAGVWNGSLPLAPGTYQYKFIVDGTSYVSDPANPDGVPDGFGHENSLVTVDCSGRIAPSAGGSDGAGGGQ
jgi:hypothetical protein